MEKTQTVKLAEMYSFTVLNLLFPGLLILETVFQVGLFSGGVEGLYLFVLLVVWSIALSMPYVIFTGMYLKVNRLLGLPDDSPNISAMASGAIRFPLNVVLALTTVVVFKFLDFYSLTCKWAEFLPPSYVRFLLSLAVTTALGFPIGWIYGKLLQVTLLKKARSIVAAPKLDESQTPERQP